MVLSSLLVAAVGGASLGDWIALAPGASAVLPIQLLFVLSTFALTLVTHTDVGESVLQWMADRYWVRLLVWLAFGAAMGSVVWDLMQLEFVAQFRSFQG